MSWKTAYRSFYYENVEEPDDITLDPTTTALLIIDIQNTYLEVPEDPEEARRWQPFFDRMNTTVIPNTADLVAWARDTGIEVMFARIACQKTDGRDRSLSQKKPGFNYLLLPKDREDSQIVPELEPAEDEVVVTKTTDSALTGTNLRLMLSNMRIRDQRSSFKTTDSALTGTNLRLMLSNMRIRDVIVAGIFTDQCVSSTVRSLCDESFGVLVVEDCCTAATEILHRHELEIINMIYCHVVVAADVKSFVA